ncbi:MAG: NADH-quinone oxidoreductase subunit NuoH, partial [Pseudomonadota bacterium]
RGSAWMQGRVGPNRAGPFGFFQPAADGIKFLCKEAFIPDHANKFLYVAAPAVAMLAPFLAMALIPFGSHLVIMGHQVPLQIASFDSGVILLLAFTGLEVYPVIVGGWSANNKYSLLGAIRGACQLVSYGTAMGLALLSALVIYGTFDLNEIVQYQQDKVWGCFINPIGALIFLICIFAETNRLPFDLPEGDSEIVGGYHLEYGAMKFSLFFMAEYVAMIMAGGLISTLFFGGYALLPGFAFLAQSIASAFSFDADNLQNVIAVLQFAGFFLKVFFFMCFYIWIRWTLPRFRFDQVINLGWKILLPLSLVNVALMGLVSYWINRG